MSDRTLPKHHAKIKLDYDGAVDQEEIKTYWSSLLSRMGREYAGYTSVPSPSGTGRHVTIDLTQPPRSPIEVVAIQAILGSDPYREAMNLRRALVYFELDPEVRDTWNVLYRKDGRRRRYRLGGET